MTNNTARKKKKVVGYLLEYPVLCSVFGMSILYVWSQIFRDTTVSFFFGLQFKVGSGKDNNLVLKSVLNDVGHLPAVGPRRL